MVDTVFMDRELEVYSEIRSFCRMLGRFVYLGVGGGSFRVLGGFLSESCIL